VAFRLMERDGSVSAEELARSRPVLEADGAEADRLWAEAARRTRRLAPLEGT
jgi:hypothetical protein